ncbi:MAG TPA: arsenic resistance protein [Nitrososphaeraceae archaeon]|nr:arsenic resistance protein [Nitrososphaeraceae archaeon]
MRDGLNNSDSDDLSPIRRGGIGSMLVLLSAMVSIITGVLFPTTGMSLEPYLLVWLGGLLYVNLINLHPRHLVNTFHKPKALMVFTIGKLILLPCIVYVITSLVYPKLALSATLLSGISTGLGAPFAINFIGAGGIGTIAALVTISSLVVPVTLPFILYVFFEDTGEFVIPIYDISFLLVIALFIPLSLGWSTRKYVPRVSKFVAGNSLFLSVIFIILINFSMFARFSQYFFIDQSLVLTSLISASLLFVLYLLVGYLLALSIKGQLITTRINGIIAMTYINNILVFVVAERFFDIETAALAALYNIPYYVGLLVLRMKYSRCRNQESK